LGNFTPRGSLGFLTNQPLIDQGTLCRQLSTAPNMIGMSSTSGERIGMEKRIQVGEAKRRPGFNFDGSPAEDMMSGDRPATSAAIKNDAVFSESDAELELRLKGLLTSLSTGSMETVALEMQRRFASGSGKTYESETLNNEVRKNPAFLDYHRSFGSDLASAIQACNYDPNQLRQIPMKLLNFSSFSDKIGGLGITIHQVWSVRADISNFSLHCGTRIWGCNVHYTLYDHFGLDWADIVKHGDDHLPLRSTGNGFKAWYILQHYRSAKPFITKIDITERLIAR